MSTTKATTHTAFDQRSEARVRTCPHNKQAAPPLRNAAQSMTNNRSHQPTKPVSQVYRIGATSSRIAPATVQRSMDGRQIAPTPNIGPDSRPGRTKFRGSLNSSAALLSLKAKIQSGQSPAISVVAISTVVGMTNG